MERYLEWPGGLNTEWESVLSNCSAQSKSSKAGGKGKKKKKKSSETQVYPDINLTMQNVCQICSFILWGVSVAVPFH